MTPTPNGIVLSGAVASNDAAEKVAAAAQRYVGEKDVVVNNLEVAGPAQVNLRVASPRSSAPSQSSSASTGKRS